MRSSSHIKNRKMFPLVVHEHAEPGEVEVILDPDQFPLLLRRRELEPLIVHKAVHGSCKSKDLSQDICQAAWAAVGKGAPLQSSIPAAALPPAGVAQNAARSIAGSPNDHLQAGRAPARAGAAAESALSTAERLLPPEYLARILSRRRCECCGWSLLPKHITGACVVCRRSVVCRGCKPQWHAVCYTCRDSLAKAETLHYTC